MKYIDAEKLIAKLQKRTDESKSMKPSFDQFWAGQISAFKGAIKIAESLQQEQPKDKQIVIITESHGDANIEWDCRSLDDVITLLKSAESFISNKQVEKLRGPGSGPDYNTEEERYSYLFKRQQERPEIQDGKFVFPKYLYARTKDNKTIDMSYAPQDMTAVEYIRNDFVEQEQPLTIEKVVEQCKKFGGNPEVIQQEVDLEKEVKRYFMDSGYELSSYECYSIARHFYELGLNARKV